MASWANKKRTTRSARRTIVLTLLGVLAMLGGAAYTVHAAGGKPDFTVSGSPSSQTIAQGQSATFSFTITRQNGFTGPIALSLSGQPSTGTTLTWNPGNVASAKYTVAASQTSATLTVSTSSSTPTGTYYLIVTSTGGKITHYTALTLIIQQAAQPNFAVSASPSTQTVVQGDQTSYTVTVTRQNGFSGSVTLGVSGLPNGATASWSPSNVVPPSATTATLLLSTASNASTGSFQLAVYGSGTIGSSTVFRFAAVTLVIQQNQSFQITGNLTGLLYPGMKVPLDLTLTNPFNFDLKITGIAVAVEEATSRAGCSGTQNFQIAQIPSGRYPITLPANQSKTLTQLGVADNDKPKVEMLNLPANQDACKNASIHLQYNGSATK